MSQGSSKEVATRNVPYIVVLFLLLNAIFCYELPIHAII